jgi:hypothetical protein
VDLILCWFIAPIGLLAAAVGLSFWVERLTAMTLPWTVRPAMGMAAMIVIAQFGTATETTAKLILPGVLILALLGLILFRRLATPRPGAAEISIVLTVFFVFSLPFLVAGEATWAGYIKLDDNATWLAITTHVFEHGRGLGNLAPSTNQQVIQDYLGAAYPIGGFVPMAVMSKISGQDVAFTLQPSMAVAAAMMTLLLFEIARRVVRGVGASALIAIAASLSALFLGYYLWGGVKELVTAALLPLGPVLAGQAARQRWPRRGWATLSITVAAIIVVLGPGGGLWAIPILIPALALAVRRSGTAGALRLAVPVAVLALLLVLPVIFTPTGPFDPLNSGITGEAEIGNLFRPLSPLQAAGIWPALDFRVDPHLNTLIRVISAVCIALAAAAIAMALCWKREEGIPLAGYVGGGAVGAAAIIAYASTWVDAKVLATLSPGVLFGALLALVIVSERTEFRLEARTALVLLLGFVAWGAFLAYQGTWLAPRAHYAELEKIGEEFDGEGPALVTEVSGYGPRHFLAGLDAEGASDRRRREVLLRNGEPTPDAVPVDLDEIRPDQLDPYNLLVLRRGPATSRPPSEFRLAYSSDHYEVWRRAEAPGTLIEQLPLGTELDAGAVPRCSQVAALGGKAGTGGSLVAARVGTPIAVEFDAAELPAAWSTPTAYTFSPSGSGTATVEISVPGGEYEVWLGGEVFGAVHLSVDGEQIAFERGVLNNNGGLEQLATLPIAAGGHQLEVEYSGASLFPGSAVHPYAIGPLELRAPQGGDLGLTTVAPSEYRDLCGERWDWVEARAASSS